MRRGKKRVRASLLNGSGCKADTSPMASQNALQGLRRGRLHAGTREIPLSQSRSRRIALTPTIVTLADSLHFDLPCLPHALTRPGGPCQAPRPPLVRSPFCASPSGSCGKPSVDCADMTWSCTSSQSDCPFSAWRVVLEAKVGRSTSTRFTGGPADKSAARLSIALIGALQTYPVGNTSQNRGENTSPPHRQFARAVCLTTSG